MAIQYSPLVDEFSAWISSMEPTQLKKTLIAIDFVKKKTPLHHIDQDHHIDAWGRIPGFNRHKLKEHIIWIDQQLEAMVYKFLKGKEVSMKADGAKVAKLPRIHVMCAWEDLAMLAFRDTASPILRGTWRAGDTTAPGKTCGDFFKYCIHGEGAGAHKCKYEDQKKETLISIMEHSMLNWKKRDIGVFSICTDRATNEHTARDDFEVFFPDDTEWEKNELPASVQSGALEHFERYGCFSNNCCMHGGNTMINHVVKKVEALDEAVKFEQQVRTYFDTTAGKKEYHTKHTEVNGEPPPASPFERPTEVRMAAVVRSQMHLLRASSVVKRTKCPQQAGQWDSNSLALT
eukprot:gene11675-7427_t